MKKIFSAMASREEKPEERIAKALGAQRSSPIEGLPSQGPLDLLHLREELEHRLRCFDPRSAHEGQIVGPRG